MAGAPGALQGLVSLEPKVDIFWQTDGVVVNNETRAKSSVLVEELERLILVIRGVESSLVSLGAHDRGDRRLVAWLVELKGSSLARELNGSNLIALNNRELVFADSVSIEQNATRELLPIGGMPQRQPVKHHATHILDVL